MIKPHETLATRACENIHKQLVSIPAPVRTGRVVVLVESRAGVQLAPSTERIDP
jgi:hypothetical protein